MSAPKPWDIVAVRAIDGRWNYGPAMHADLMRSEEYGVYPDKFTAFNAGREAVRELGELE